MPISLDALLTMSNDALFEIVRAAEPLDLEALADTSYTGIDLSMPAIFHKLFWKSFRKTFHRDPATGVLRGWNVKVQQSGWDSPPEPKRGRDGRALSFGHYEVRSARGLSFPRGWTGEHYLDYRFAGNAFYEVPARNGYCPLVSVNGGSSELLLGWEIFKFGPVAVPLRDFWVLKREGALAPVDVVPRPDAKRTALPS
jgi:hypothetical protein